MGQQIFDIDGNFTVPIGITSVTICMCGGGGSGSMGRADGGIHKYCGGGFAGLGISTAHVVVSEAVIPVTVGVGGVGYTPVGNADVNGNAGTNSTFDTLVATGGAGGTVSGNDSGAGASFTGSGESISSCGGTFNNGTLQGSTVSPGNYQESQGGQAGVFGNGGNGRYSSEQQAPGIGAGSGGSTYFGENADAPMLVGGNGRVIVTWDDAPTGAPEFRINGTVIPESGGTVIFGDKATDANYSVTTVMENGEVVWAKQGVAGGVSVDYNAIAGQNPETVTGANGLFTFTVPIDITSINYCMAGAGGGGGTAGSGSAGGGNAGEVLSGTLSVVALSVISINIGLGGASVNNGAVTGGAGTPSILGAVNANGGAGGVPLSGYLGDGGERTTCGGTFTDGTLEASLGLFGYGGEAGGFGNGGNGRYSAPATAGGIGAGGGGVAQSQGGGEPSGVGGNGRIEIFW